MAGNRVTRSYAQLAAALFAQNQFAIKYDLDAMRTACGVLGLDHRPVARRTVLVGGTNGKGSTSALLNAAGIAAGMRVGLYTSPHLIDLRERLRFSGHPVAAEAFAATAWELYDRFGAPDSVLETPRPLTYFELLTLTAFDMFAAADLDLAIVEVGLGGRLDATNVLEPDVSVITSVSLDHQAFLGDSVSSIAAEKACIARRGRPAVIHRDAGGHAELVSALATHAPRIVEVDGGEDPRGYAMALAAGAVDALDEPRLRRAASTGFGRAMWPGRQQILHRNGVRYFIDGAHNEASIAEAAAWLARVAPAPVPVVVAASRGRDPSSWATRLAPCASRFIATTTVEAPCAPAYDTAAAVRTAGRPVVAASSPEGALREAGGPDVAVIGSLYLVGEVLAALGLGVDDLSVYDDAPKSP